MFLMAACALEERHPQLSGFAKLPAETFSAGPTSGQFISVDDDRPLPFKNKQPVQGFSAILKNGDGSFLVMPDNGFGSQENSADFILCVYEIRPNVRTAKGGAGDISFRPFLYLHDPDNKIDFPIVADMETYPAGDGDIPVDETIKSRRLLTGADFDLESLQRAPDGTLYFGDEFGPFIPVSYTHLTLPTKRIV